MLLSDLISTVTEKPDVRAKRIGIPGRAYSIRENTTGTTASLFICGNEGDDVVEVLRLSCPQEGSAAVCVRQSACDHCGVPNGPAVGCVLPEGWHSFDYPLDEADAARYISLYAADILEYEFGLYETKAEPFDCCSRQYTCSIRGECLHPDQLYAKACSYRKTLLTGNQF